MLCNAMWDGGIRISAGWHYEGVWGNVISVTRGSVCVKFLGEKRYVILEWLLERTGFTISLQVPQPDHDPRPTHAGHVALRLQPLAVSGTHGRARAP